MNEFEWMYEEANASWLLVNLRGTPVTRTKVGQRRLRLFACGCCRLLGPGIDDPRLRRAVETAELFADGKATAEQLRAAGTTAGAVDAYQFNAARELVISATAEKPYEAAFGVTRFTLPFSARDILRDVLGNPFKKVNFEARWRTDTAVALARTMYEARDFGAMPILADALQDAECGNRDILNHCRGPGPHVRGCWVVDHVLGRG
jgi:hypothetical protein